jgi:SAM-dependent MidA family methyltransferase
LEKGLGDKAGPVVWINDPAEIPTIDGLAILIANEFFDALPFHRVVNTESGLKEIYIDFAEGYVELLGPLSAAVENFLRSHPLSLNLHQSVEVTTRSLDILADLTARLEEALLLVFDYGYHTAELAHGRFFDGSVVGYKDMKLRQSMFGELGTTDITHHVNFDHLAAILDRLGWVKAGEIEQYRFLLDIGVLEHMAALPDAERHSAKGVINPQGIGSMISVLGFTKNITCGIPGFARKPF